MCLRCLGLALLGVTAPVIAFSLCKIYQRCRVCHDFTGYLGGGRSLAGC